MDIGVYGKWKYRENCVCSVWECREDEKSF